MEAREFAHRIVTTTSLAQKLEPAPASLSDRRPGEPVRLERPGRPAELPIVPGRAAKVPPLEGMPDVAQRARIIHALANHEFQAVELFAWALLAFADAPAEFRGGLLRVLDDEQRHTRMYIGCLRSHGCEFGDFPVSGYFWNKTPDIRSPQDFVCAMSLTFENANLDHTIENARAARAAGDERLAAVIEQVERDEVEHVRFGWTWLERFKDEGETMWQAYCRSLSYPLRPGLARGAEFHPEGRRRAGLDESFVERLSRAVPGLAAGYDADRDLGA